MKPSILQRLSKLWTHIQYYKYEPSKPSRSEFLRLIPKKQGNYKLDSDVKKLILKYNDIDYELYKLGIEKLNVKY